MRLLSCKMRIQTKHLMTFIALKETHILGAFLKIFCLYFYLQGMYQFFIGVHQEGVRSRLPVKQLALSRNPAKIFKFSLFLVILSSTLLPGETPLK